MKNPVRKLITPGLLGLLLMVSAFIPKADDPIKKLVAALAQWTEIHPQEKVYLHMDKPYYALGDTIWFKGYLTSGSRHKFSPVSGALYVDLINEKDSILKTLKLPVTNGMVMGDIALDEELKQGSYRVRAYTQWMRNAGEDYYFDRTFTVGNSVTNNVIARADYQYIPAGNKPVLNATLTYANDNGKPLSGKSVEYEIVIDKKTVWRGTDRTNTKGNISLKIPNDDGLDFSGAAIKTTIKTADETVKRDFPIKAGLAQSDVQFFPEGGYLVSGLTTQVGFKAIGVNGLGLAIKGKIIDDNNKEIALLQTLRAGMGSFSIKPEIGRTYKALITFPDGSAKTIALPKPLMEGYSMNVEQVGDTVMVRLYGTTIMSPGLNVIAQSGGEVIASRSVALNNGATGFRLPKKAFPAGIAQFTVFNAAGDALMERVAFIRNNDNLELSLKTEKNIYSSKQAVALEMLAMDSNKQPTAGFFSVAVIDESKVPVDEDAESTIFTNLLLTSDLKGYVEKPNYYLAKQTAEVNKALDNLMLTQGYRRFSWKGLNGISKPVFAAEGLGVTISGRATTLGNKPAANASVMLLSVKARVQKLTTTDGEGRFKFDGIFLTDSIKFAVQARNAKNSDKINILLDSVPKQKVSKNSNLGDVSTDIAATLKAYMESARKQDSIFEKLGMLDRVHRLRQININARKPKEQPYKTQGMIRIPEGHSDQTFYMKNTDCANLSICLMPALNAVVFKQLIKDGIVVTNYPHCYLRGQLIPMDIILDGRALNFEDAADVLENNYVDNEGIYKIEVIRTPGGLVGVSLMIFTKADYVRKRYNPSIANISPKGFNRAREFYSPKYDLSETAQTLPDTRTTVYWNPRVQTDIAGQTTIKYFNADGPGTYRVVVEGMNADGELGRKVFKYTVQ